MMPGLALSDALRDFGSRPPARVEREPAPIEVPLPVAPTIDIDGIVAAEVEKTEMSVTQRLSAVYEHTLQAERDNHAAELERLRTQLGEKAANIIAVSIAQSEARLIELTTTTVARVLAGIASDEMQRRSVEALSRTIANALDDTDAVRVRVRGPLSLYEALQKSLGPRAATFDFRESTDFDLSVDIDGNLFETRLAEWSAAVGEVVA